MPELWTATVNRPGGEWNCKPGRTWRRAPKEAGTAVAVHAERDGAASACRKNFAVSSADPENLAVRRWEARDVAVQEERRGGGRAEGEEREEEETGGGEDKNRSMMETTPTDLGLKMKRRGRRRFLRGKRPINASIRSTCRISPELPVHRSAPPPGVGKVAGSAGHHRYSFTPVTRTTHFRVWRRLFLKYFLRFALFTRNSTGIG